MVNKKNRGVEDAFISPIDELDKTVPGFNEEPSEKPVLHISPRGQPIGRERYQPRFKNGGVVFLHCANKKVIRAKARDLSKSGVGLGISKKLKTYRIGERFILEFSPPHRLQSVLLMIELARYTNVDGDNHLGFRIVAADGRANKTLNEYIAYLDSLDSWV